MRLFTDNEAKQILKRWEIETGEELYEYEYDKIVQIYGNVINDDVNKTKGKLEQESMLTYMADSVYAQKAMGSEGNVALTWKYIENHFSDNRHLDFFSNFMDEKTVDKLKSVFTKNKIPTSVLSGLKTGVKNHFIKEENGHRIEIEGYFDPSPTGKNEENDYLIAWIDGEEAFNWSSDIAKENTNTDFNKINITRLKEELEKIQKQHNTTKKGKLTKSNYIKTYIIGNRIIEERVDSRGVTFFMDKTNNSHRVSRSEVL